MPLAGLLALAAGGLTAETVQAACPSDAEVSQVAREFIEKRPIAGYGKGMKLSDAYCAQARYVRILEMALGPRAGYKVGFTGKETQERFGMSGPGRGVLFRGMLLRSPGRLPAAFGARPMFEADLMVVVKDAGINEARTPLEAAQHLSEVVPFIELPDLLIAKGHPLDGPGLIALNVVPRHGVLGKGIPIDPTPAFVEAFAAMRATLTDDRGQVILDTTGATLMGNPLNVVLWLVEHLGQQGERLEAGDVISLGSLGGLLPPEAGRTLTLRYEGLPGGDGQAQVSFE